MENNQNQQNESIISPDYSVIIEELKTSFIKFKNSTNKKNFVRALIENENVIKLLIALTEKDMDELTIYIIENFTINNNENKSDFRELIILLIKKHKFKVIESMIKNEILNISEIRDSDGNTPLILATIYSDIQLVKLFLKQFPRLLDKKNKQELDALTISVYNNDNLIFFLIANNLTAPILNINELCKLAIRNGNIEILKYLTEKPTYVEDTTILHHAAAQKNIDIFRHILNLITKYNELDSHGEIPLHWAVLKGSYFIVEQCIKVLKENRLEIDHKSKHGITPFHLALLKKDKDICRLLYENGADVNEIDNEGNSIVHMLAALGDLKWLKHIVKHFNANCYQKNSKGDIPLITAIINGKNDIVEYFVSRIPNLNWKNKMGQTPLHAAVYSNDVKIVELLLKYKADLTVKDLNGLTPYHYAYVEKKSDVIKVIHTVLNLEKKRDE
jgi:ankyrin repeat protein